MLQNYIQAAIRRAKYEFIPNEGYFYCEIPECRGVFVKANSIEEAREEIIEILEEWLFIRLRKNLDIPIIDDIDLNKLEFADAAN